MKGIEVLVVLALALGMVGSVFAVWPAVADAPWEPETAVPVVREVADEPSRCDRFTAALAAASSDQLEFRIWNDGERYNCW